MMKHFMIPGKLMSANHIEFSNQPYHYILSSEYCISSFLIG